MVVITVVGVLGVCGNRAFNTSVLPHDIRIMHLLFKPSVHKPYSKYYIYKLTTTQFKDKLKASRHNNNL